MSFAFIVGCVTATVAQSVTVPPAKSADVQRWEYVCKDATQGITKMANELGAEGWELAGSGGAGAGEGMDFALYLIWCFKRPL